jgi:GNAT superfamily N-acetyltransferase
MNQLSPIQQVLCRPAIEADQADITKFCKGIWDGEDYVPQVWERWFHDPDGLLAAAEYEGHAIGCSKISRISRGQWWLEGFRVDPQYQGLKVGSHLHHHVTDWWLAHGEGTLRLMTDARNFVVHHLCDKTGYLKAGEVCGYRAPSLKEPADNFIQTSNMEAAAVFALESEFIKTTRGLIDLGWRICKPGEETFKNCSDENADYVHTFYWWRDRQGLFSAWEDEDEERRTLVLGAVACALSDTAELLLDIRRFAAGRKFDDIFQIAFDIPQVTAQLLSAGFEKHWKRSNAFFFEKTQPFKVGNS